MAIHNKVRCALAGAAVMALTVAGVASGAAAAVSPPMAPAGAATGQQSSPDADGLVHQVQRRGGRGFRRGGGIRRGGFRRGRGIRRGGIRRGRGFRRRGGRWIGPAIGAGIAGAILGGGYYYDRPYYYRTRRYYGPRRVYRSAWRRCDRRYRSFRWSDGTFQPYGGGPRRLCPYLR